MSYHSVVILGLLTVSMFVGNMIHLDTGTEWGISKLSTKRWRGTTEESVKTQTYGREECLAI